MTINTWQMSARRGEHIQTLMPTLKHFFPCNNSKTKLIDSQGGVVFNPRTARSTGVLPQDWTYHDSLQALEIVSTLDPAETGINSVTPLESGEWTFIPDGKAILMVWVSTTTRFKIEANYDTRLHIGYTGAEKGPTDGERQGFQFAQDMHYTIGDVSTPAPDRSMLAHNIGTAEEQSENIPVVYYFKYSDGVGQYAACRVANLETTPTEFFEGVLLTSSTNILFSDDGSFLGGWKPSPYFYMDGLALQGFSFNIFGSATLPTDWFDAVKWQATNWAAGNRIPYPEAVNWT